MKDIVHLTKVLLKNVFQRTGTKSKSMIIVYIVAFSYIAGIMGFLSYGIIKPLIEIHQEGVFITVILLGLTGFVLVQTIFTSLNTLFFSKDIEYILPLPIHSAKILASKFNVLIISEYIIELIVALVPLSIFGYLTHATLMYYIVMVIVLAIYPIIPILLASILMIIVVRFTNVFKNKDFVQYISVGLVIALCIGVQFIGGNGNSEISSLEIANKLVETNGMVSIYEGYFITLGPATNAMLNYNNFECIKNLGILVMETSLAYAFVVFVGSKFYIKTATKGLSGGGKKGKKLNIKKDYIKTSKLKSYLKKEFKNLIRNPIFFMQCIMPAILIPVVFSIPFWTLMKDPQAGEMMAQIKDVMGTTFGFSICFAIISFFFVFNFSSVTAISRDGQNATFMKHIPISLYKQSIYKVLPSIILNIVPIVYVVVLIKIIALGISNTMILHIVIITFLLNILQSFVMLIVDLKRPKLNWSSEYAVVKQNFNMFFEMLFGFIVITAVMLLTTVVKDMNIYVGIIITFLLLAIYIVNRYMYKNQLKLFKKII